MSFPGLLVLVWLPLAQGTSWSERLGELERAWSEVTDYRCRFTRQERVGERLLEREELDLRFRKPFSVHLIWVGRVHRGREAVYVAGRNKGKIHAREGGLLRFLWLDLDPRGGTAMAGNRHPLTEIGLGRAIEILAAERSEQLAAAERENFDGRAVSVFDLLPSRAGEVARRCVWVDEERALPLRIEGFDARGRLLERYEYLRLSLDVGLGDDDFPT